MVQNAYHHLKTSKVTFCIPEDIQVTILHDKKEENLHIWEVFFFFFPCFLIVAALYNLSLFFHWYFVDLISPELVS